MQCKRLSDGPRKITHISEVLPAQEQGYALHHVFAFQQSKAQINYDSL